MKSGERSILAIQGILLHALKAYADYPAGKIRDGLQRPTANLASCCGPRHGRE